MTGEPLPPAPAGAPIVGVEIEGKYRLVRLIGQGSVGTVFEAENLVVGRRVALRFLHPRLRADEAIQRRFVQESRQVGALQHDNIAHVIDIGQNERFGPYAVMELVEGESLQKILERDGALSIERALDCAAQILSALAAAHSKGILAGDLHPANIMLTGYGGRKDVIKLLDFGLSKYRVGSAPELASPYLAPEQTTQGPQPVDGRADVYSTGIILYEALTGMRPASQPPSAPSTIRPDLPPGLDRCVLRALALAPAARWQNASDFRESLRPFTTMRLTRPVSPVVLNDGGSQGALEQSIHEHMAAEASFWSQAHAVRPIADDGSDMWEAPRTNRAPIVIVAVIVGVGLFGGLAALVAHRSPKPSEEKPEIAAPVAPSTAPVTPEPTPSEAAAPTPAPANAAPAPGQATAAGETPSAAPGAAQALNPAETPPALPTTVTPSGAPAPSTSAPVAPAVSPSPSPATVAPTVPKTLATEKTTEAAGPEVTAAKPVATKPTVKPAAKRVRAKAAPRRTTPTKTTKTTSTSTPAKRAIITDNPY